METTKTKRYHHKGGYAMLKEKYAKLKEENELLLKEDSEKQKTIEKQGTTISNLTAQLASAKADLENEISTRKRLWLHMGWFRRLLWKHKSPVMIS